jgi:hypothetical protein
MQLINMKKIINYSCENIFKKRPKNIIWLNIVLKPIFDMVPNGTTKEWVCWGHWLSIGKFTHGIIDIANENVT